MSTLTKTICIECPQCHAMRAIVGDMCHSCSHEPDVDFWRTMAGEYGANIKPDPMTADFGRVQWKAVLIMSYYVSLGYTVTGYDVGSNGATTTGTATMTKAS